MLALFSLTLRNTFQVTFEAMKHLFPVNGKPVIISNSNTFYKVFWGALNIKSIALSQILFFCCFVSLSTPAELLITVTCNSHMQNMKKSFKVRDNYVIM